jgi:hypothetical protein
MFGLFWLASKSIFARDVLHWIQTRNGAFLPCQVIPRPLPITVNHAYFQVKERQGCMFHRGKNTNVSGRGSKSETRLRVKRLAPHPLTGSR